jgi:predicted metal-dependent enzyme (double-stranded beta helix superfamily)
VLDDFVTACRQAAALGDANAAVRTLLSELVANPQQLAKQIPAPTPDDCGLCGFDNTLFEDHDVTIIVVHSRPGVVQPPHDHSMPAFIGVYQGAEAQRFFRRGTTTGDMLVETPGQTIQSGEVLSLGSAAIHAISTADGRWARAVHVYLGPLSSVDRSLYNPATSQPEPMTAKRYDELAMATP